MAYLRIYFQLQVVLLICLGLYVDRQYSNHEPVTRLMVDTSWKTITHATGYCDHECYNTWRQQMMTSPQTHQAIQKVLRWLMQSPRAAEFVVSRMSIQTKKQLMALVTLSRATPESALLFQKAYGISPDDLHKLLTK